ncbi:lysine 5,6-aminomutase reactivase ATPase KamC [Alkaliphilus transvaalensis]|uniref:lysine 5,6-aminomutase reactivase ATPase KamC n=1 Tax=Alkaliphilus transvaalensis TaxID=114628 RepID=UPI00047D0BBF|nr:hypothetical protein [Alkaliphilus transvaalensis]
MRNEEKINNIDLEYILNQLKIHTPYGKDCLKNLKPYRIKELSSLKVALDDLGKVMKSLSTAPQSYHNMIQEFSRIKDIRGSIKRCKNRGILDDIELFEIKRFAIYGEEIRKNYEGLGISIEGVNFNNLEEVIDLLDPEGQNLATFSIYDAYSDHLKEVREKKRLVEKLIYQETNLNKLDKLEDLKNERLKWIEEENCLENEIREKLSFKLLAYLEKIEKNINSLGILDFTIAKAKLALGKGCTKPQFNGDLHLVMEEGRHPYLEDLLEGQNRKFTKVSIRLLKGCNVITGPNMGGKSVTLKTLGINVLLAHMGFYVFADRLELPIFNFIHLLANDYESLRGGLSTFGGEIVKINDYIKDIKMSSGLLLVDEFASGTNPHEGRLLVKAVMDYLKGFKTISVFITHFDGVVEDDINHYQVIGLKHVDFKGLMNGHHLDSTLRLKIIQELMDYRLEPVKKDKKVPIDALNIATLLGLESEIINIAKSYYDKEVQFYGEETE